MNLAIPQSHNVIDGQPKLYTILYTGIISPPFYFRLFAVLSEGEFKTGLIELYTRGYIRKWEIGRIQDWANEFQISVGWK